MSKRFENKFVVITGAAGGMGMAFARRFAAKDASLILTDVDEKGLEQAAATTYGMASSFGADGIPLTHH